MVKEAVEEAKNPLLKQKKQRQIQTRQQKLLKKWKTKKPKRQRKIQKRNLAKIIWQEKR